MTPSCVPAAGRWSCLDLEFALLNVTELSQVLCCVVLIPSSTSQPAAVPRWLYGDLKSRAGLGTWLSCWECLPSMHKTWAPFPVLHKPNMVVHTCKSQHLRGRGKRRGGHGQGHYIFFVHPFAVRHLSWLTMLLCMMSWWPCKDLFGCSPRSRTAESQARSTFNSFP